MVDEAKVGDILLATLLTNYKRVFPKAGLLGHPHEIPKYLGSLNTIQLLAPSLILLRMLRESPEGECSTPTRCNSGDIRWEGDGTRMLFYLKSFY